MRPQRRRCGPQSTRSTTPPLSFRVARLLAESIRCLLCYDPSTADGLDHDESPRDSFSGDRLRGWMRSGPAVSLRGRSHECLWVLSGESAGDPVESRWRELYCRDQCQNGGCGAHCKARGGSWARPVERRLSSAPIFFFPGFFCDRKNSFSSIWSGF